MVSILSATIAALIATVTTFFSIHLTAFNGPFGSSGPVLPERAHILIAGDMNFDRYIRTVTGRRGDDFIFSCIDDTLSHADIVLANLEGPITPYESMSEHSTVETPENYTFTFPTSTGELLKRHNLYLVNIGNNHIMNFGRGGLMETLLWLERAGVQHMGNPDAIESERVARMEIQGVPLSFVNWSDWTSDNTDITAMQIRKEKASGRVVIVYAHWGDEYTAPPERVKRLAHSFVDVGADLVVGSHPHIIQEHEVYAGKNIYYSLGNFIFDQYWDDDVRTGLLLDVTVTKEGVESVEEHRTYLESDGRTCLKSIVSN